MITASLRIHRTCQAHLFDLFTQVTEAMEDGLDLLKNTQASLKAEIQETKE